MGPGARLLKPCCERFPQVAGYLTSRPVTARPMIMRWISDVPSKIVKFSDLGVPDQEVSSEAVV